MNKNGVSYNAIKSEVHYERFEGGNIWDILPSKALSLCLLSFLPADLTPLFSSVPPSPVQFTIPFYVPLHSTHVPRVQHPTLFYCRSISLRANPQYILMAGVTHGRHGSCLSKREGYIRTEF